MSLRRTVLSALEALEFKFGTRKFGLFGPSITYQDLPWAGVSGGRRADGSSDRLLAMREHLNSKQIQPITVLDIGCNVGYFATSFASTGSLAYGVEMDPMTIRIAQLASQKIANTEGLFVPIQLTCTPDTVQKLPHADVSICFSIWHHWVRHQGLAEATEILKAIWDHTGKVMYFDTGENEMPEEFNLPFRGEDSKQWLLEYLARELTSSVEILGSFKAFIHPDFYKSSSELRRNLFAIIRE